MQPSLLFWTGALVNLGVVCGVALLGVRCARRGEIARHRRAMKLASGLVFAFLLAYGMKVQLIGREDRSLWSAFDLWVLRVHEVFVVLMLGAGATAWIQSRRLLGTRAVTRDAKDPDPDPNTLRIHRRAGRIAVVSAVLGFLLAVGVLIGMVRRLTD